jgi:hypothetical protein
VKTIVWAVLLVVVTGWSALSFPAHLPGCARASSITCLTPWGKWGLSVVVLCWLIWPKLAQGYRWIRWAMAMRWRGE